MTESLSGEAQLEPLLVGDIAGDFYVPAYQRGYRWGIDEVARLIVDIVESEGRPYYLQPVVVKGMADGRWELVDGQQRLTTLYLILRYLQQEILPSAELAYSIQYETRPESQEYLQSLTPVTVGLPHEESNIDFFHMRQAYEFIANWFTMQHNKVQVGIDFYTYLFKSVRVIWYEAAPEVDSTTLFTRLNVGRIPLTDAELVKALLLTRSRTAVGGTDRAQEIAAHWDLVERELRDPELWAFVTGTADGVPTHISLLLDTLAGGPSGRERPLYHTFETLRLQIDTDPADVWQRIVNLYELVVGWHEDRDLFHKVGYLIATGAKFAQLVELSLTSSKSKFEAALDGLIRADLGLTAAAVADLGYDSGKTGQALLLMNVETVRRMQQSFERYSFRAHASGAWSMEHIDAQNAEKLTRAAQWTEWLRLHRAALEAFPHVSDDKRVALIERIDAALVDITEDAFRAVERDVIDTFKFSEDASDDMHSVSNLALLSSGDNSALSNAVFETKRREIIKRDKAGSYIPACTRNVFLKYYSDGDDLQLHFWSHADRDAYLRALVETISPYLKSEEISA